MLRNVSSVSVVIGALRVNGADANYLHLSLMCTVLFA